MREHYTADWAFAIKGSIENTVSKEFPQELHSWPMLKSFDFEVYKWNEDFLIFILKDKLSGIPTGPGKPKNIDIDAPGLPTLNNIQEWHSVLRSHFDLNQQDGCMIIPVYESGKNVEDDWDMWPQQERDLWHRQLQMIVTNQFYYKRGVSNLGDFYIPPGYNFLKEEVVRFFNDNPNYNKNIFIMTRFVPGNKLLETLDDNLRSVLKSYGLNPLRADDKMYMRDRNLWNNVCTYMIGCKYGIAILEDRLADEFNPNVALEYGFMRGLNKPTLLLADVGFRNLRADIIGTLRETFDITDIENTIKNPIETWLKEIDLI